MDRVIGQRSLHGPPSTLQSMVDHAGHWAWAPVHAGSTHMRACGRPRTLVHVLISIGPDYATAGRHGPATTSCTTPPSLTFFRMYFTVWTPFGLFLGSLDSVRHLGPHCGLNMDRISRCQISTIFTSIRYSTSTCL